MLFIYNVPAINISFEWLDFCRALKHLNISQWDVETPQPQT